MAQAWWQRWTLLLGIVVVLGPVDGWSRQAVSFFYSDTPPYEFTDDQGQAAGIAIIKVRKLFEAAGWQVNFHFDSVQRGTRALEQTIDFTTVVAPTEQQRQQFVISEEPLYQIELGVVRDRHTMAVTQWADLLKQPYLVLRDTRFAFLQNEPSLQPILQLRYDVATKADALRLLNSGRFSYFFGYVSSTQAAPAPWLAVDVLGTYPVHLVVSRQHPHAVQYMKTLDALLRSTLNR